MNPCQEHFYAVLKAEFGPRLRAAGFTGSGQNFRRVTGDVIHAINVQNNKWGGSCILNLGIHLTFLPNSLNQVLDPRKIREVNCEFRTRLGSPIHADGWWAYGTEPGSAVTSARSLVDTFFERGEAHFQRFSQIAPILDALERKVFAPSSPGSELSVHLTDVRAALAGARIHRYRGDLAASQRFAQAGLNGIGAGPFAAGAGLRDVLNALAAGQPEA